MEWFQDRWDDLANLGSADWLAAAAWAALALGIVVLVYANGQLKKNRQQKNDELRPQVSMYMEPHPTDWHVIELVVRNFGATAAYDVRPDFVTPPTVAAYEHSGFGESPDIAELDLPSELNVLSPGQEWRTVWDSAINREQLGSDIQSRFDGTLTYHDRPRPEGEKAGSKRKTKRRTYETTVVLDWGTLQPVQRLELLTTHDLAKREKQKLELLRTMLTYFHYASKETQPDVFRAEIDRMKLAVKETQDRWRTRQFDQTTELDFPWINGAGDDEPARVGPSGRHRDLP